MPVKKQGLSSSRARRLLPGKGDRFIRLGLGLVISLLLLSGCESNTPQPASSSLAPLPASSAAVSRSSGQALPPDTAVPANSAAITNLPAPVNPAASMLAGPGTSVINSGGNSSSTALPPVSGASSASSPGGGGSQPKDGPGPAGPLAFALLADNRLVALQTKDGAQVAALRPGNTPNSAVTRYPGRYMALSQDNRTLYSLVPGWQDEPDRLAVIETATAQIKAVYSLKMSEGKYTGMDFPGNVYRGLAVGARTGRLYLVGNRAGGVIVTLLDPATGNELATWSARPRDGINWLVYQAALSDDERQLYIGYHGSAAGGIDRFEIADNGLVRCLQQRRDWGCIGAHGAFELYGNNLLVTYGYQVVVEENQQGTVLRGYNTGLEKSHLAEFALDKPARRLYAIGTCLTAAEYQGGFSLVDLTKPLLPLSPGEQKWITPAPGPALLLIPEPARSNAPQLPCGERLAAGPGSILVVGKNSSPPFVINAAMPGAVQLVDGTTGRIMHSLSTTSPPLDVIATGQD